MSLPSPSPAIPGNLSKPQPELRRIVDCITNEQRLERILQEMGIKAVRCYSIIKEMLIMSGFDEKKVNDEVAQTYNILKETDLENLLQVCLRKSGQDFITNGILKQKLQRIKDLVHAIMQLDKSARIIARSVVIDRYLFSNKIRTTLILMGLIILFYALQKKHDSTENHKGGARKEIPLKITTRSISSETA